MQRKGIRGSIPIISLSRSFRSDFDLLQHGAQRIARLLLYLRPLLLSAGTGGEGGALAFACKKCGQAV